MTAMSSEIKRLKGQLMDRDHKIEELNEAVASLKAEVVEHVALLEKVSDFL